MHVLAAAGSSANGPSVWAYLAIGNEVGGLLGYKIGDRWGRRILEHPGPALEWRKKTLAKGQTVYQKWGRLAVFLTPALVSGALRMKFGQFAVWNSFAGAVFVLAVGPAAYGAGRVASGHHDLVSVGMLVGGVAIGALCVVLGVRYHRRLRTAWHGPGSGKELTGVGRTSGVPGCVQLRSGKCSAAEGRR